MAWIRTAAHSSASGLVIDGVPSRVFGTYELTAQEHNTKFHSGRAKNDTSLGGYKDKLMEFEEVRERVSAALAQFTDTDRFLLEHDLNERCIASRVALYLQAIFPEYYVDVEYNRVGRPPKRLQLPDECANYRNKQGDTLAVPDVIVHRRGPEGPNLLVLEFKKTSNPDAFGCDRKRIFAFRDQLGYRYGALVECETRVGWEPAIRVFKWVHD